MLDMFQGLDLVLIVIIVGFIVWELAGLAMSLGKIQVKTKVFGRYASLAVIVVLLGIAVFQRRGELNSAAFWMIFGGVLLSSALYLLLPSGFSQRGLYFNGRLYTFEKIQYYHIERETQRSFILRLRTARREFALEFTPQERELALAWMEKGKIMSFESYMETKAS